MVYMCAKFAGGRGLFGFVVNAASFVVSFYDCENILLLRQQISVTRKMRKACRFGRML